MGGSTIAQYKITDFENDSTESISTTIGDLKFEFNISDIATGTTDVSLQINSINVSLEASKTVSDVQEGSQCSRSRAICR